MKAENRNKGLSVCQKYSDFWQFLSFCEGLPAGLGGWRVALCVTLHIGGSALKKWVPSNGQCAFLCLWPVWCLQQYIHGPETFPITKNYQNCHFHVMGPLKRLNKQQWTEGHVGVEKRRKKTSPERLLWWGEDALARRLGPLREACCVSSGSKRQQAWAASTVRRADWKSKNFRAGARVTERESKPVSASKSNTLFFHTGEVMLGFACIPKPPHLAGNWDVCVVCMCVSSYMCETI